MMTLLAVLTAGGCGQSNSGDAAPPAPPAISSPNLFLLFPNPQQQPDGTLQTDSAAYAQAYYAAIDPNNDKDTFDKWRAANGFDSGDGTQVSAVFGDVRDLGYGRRMTARRNDDGTIAVYIENYLVEPGENYTYSRLNLDAAAVQDRRWHLATSAIEFSPAPGGSVSFAKFFVFEPANGRRSLAVDVDGRGEKAMPSVCITCHGGRANPLTPPDATGRPLFPLVNVTASQSRGDVEGRLLPLEVDALDFSSTTRFTRADQEAALKAINMMVLCTYPMPAASTLPEDACRRAATANEYQGTAAELIKSVYGGDGMPSATYHDTFVPTGWSDAGETALYRSVVAPYCRSCHQVRGLGRQSDIDFDSFEKFQSYADRNKAHVIDRGNMPLAKLVFDAFWGGEAPEALAAHLEGLGFTVRDAAGAVLRPGRPVADPGPDRTVGQGPSALSADGSLYANTYAWSLVSGPDGAVPATGATLTSADQSHAVFEASSDGSYVLQLVVGNGTEQSAAAQLRLVVNQALAPLPSAIRFADVKAALEAARCGGCHSPGAMVVLASDVDRNGDGVVDATDDAWFYAEVRGEINFTDIAASPLLRKPSGQHHFAGLRSGFDTSVAPGQPERATYDLFLNWILNGAPQ